MQRYTNSATIQFRIQLINHDIKPGMHFFAPMQHTQVSEGRCGKVLREDFEFIGSGGGRFLLKVKESIMINKLNPELNGSTTSVPLHLF